MEQWGEIFKCLLAQNITSYIYVEEIICKIQITSWDKFSRRLIFVKINSTMVKEIEPFLIVSNNTKSTHDWNASLSTFTVCGSLRERRNIPSSRWCNGLPTPRLSLNEQVKKSAEIFRPLAEISAENFFLKTCFLFKS